jgi:hypothetical protein
VQRRPKVGSRQHSLVMYYQTFLDAIEPIGVAVWYGLAIGPELHEVSIFSLSAFCSSTHRSLLLAVFPLMGVRRLGPSDEHDS